MRHFLQLWVTQLIGKLDFVKATSKANDPNRVILEEFETDLPDVWEDCFPGLSDKQLLISLTVALQRSILSVFIYQKSLSCLVAEVREGGPGADKALFDAVRLDRTIMACPTAAARISKAELQNETRFFQHLRNALKGPSSKHWEGYRDLRFNGLGGLTSFMASQGITDLGEGFGEFLAQAKRFHDASSRKDGKNFRGYVTGKVADKSRRFNTLRNQTRESEKDRHALKQQKADAYRLAKQGDESLER